MTYDRYYYSKLSPEGKVAYKELYIGIQEFKKHIAVQRVSGVTPDTLLRYVGLDNPHLFYVDFGCTEGFCSEKSIIYTICYWYSEPEAKELNEKVNTTLQKMLKRVKGKTDYEKELSVHDLLVGNVCYDSSPMGLSSRGTPQKNSIVGVLFHKSAVCEGIAKVTKMRLNLLDIKCIVAYGIDTKDNVGHAWNIVKIQDCPYHLDVTWDINVSHQGFIRYDYFNLPDVAIRKGHCFVEPYPICTSKKANYYYRNGLEATSMADVERIVSKAIRSGGKYFAFRYRGGDNSMQKVSEQIRHTVSATPSPTGANKASISYSINSEQGVIGVSVY